jgi:hypothetical protein
MTIAEFNNFDHQKKSDTLWEWGYFITNHKIGNVSCAVFSLNDFFVELTLFIPANETISIVAVTETQKIKKYSEDFKFLFSHFSQLPTR